MNLCSVSSIHGVPLLAVYSTSKSQVEGLTEALAIDWGGHGIRVLSIKPPFVRTAMLDGMPAQLTKTLTVDLDLKQAAEAIVRALDGSGHGYLVGWKARTLGFPDKVLPAPLHRWVVRKVTGY